MEVYQTKKQWKSVVKEYVGIAKDLRYPSKIIERIKHAKSESEITRILKTAREESFED